MFNQKLFLPFLICVCALYTCVVSTAQESKEISFDQQIRPLLSDRCYSCHGPDENSRAADLRLDVEEAAHEYAIVPGSLEDSEVWSRIISEDESDQMPPPEAHKPKFTVEELELIKQWIEQGAVYERFWAFENPVATAVPVDVVADWKQNPIDAFVASTLAKHNILPQPEADYRTLIRRSSLDITGLPPTPTEIAEQLKLEKKLGREAAWENWLDQLLRSPRYGEHMARHWLDLVRYADTNGMHKDFYRNHFAYRDWVVRSFNKNLGYDKFVKAQLAGDLLINPTDDELTATAFNRMHLIIDRGTALPEESLHKNVVDRVTAVSTAFLGLTMQCAQCHDHKYDPITQEDFYAMYAFFNNFDVEPETPGWPENGLQEPHISLASRTQKAKLKSFDRSIKAIESRLAGLASIEKKEVAHSSSIQVSASNSKRKQTDVRKEVLQKKLKTIKAERNRFSKQIPHAMIARERETLRKTFILERGEYDSPGKEVTRNTPQFLPPMKIRGAVPTRLDLANWLVSDQHPLTSRVAVNRIWQGMMGKGLVKTSEDFGAQGSPPSHPELLDFLADDFRENGWDTKRLVKMIASSKTYRQSSTVAKSAYDDDPGNRLLARASRHRLDAEVIRDQLLFVSGQLCSDMYGPSVKPPQPDGLWKSVTMIGERYQADQGNAAVRRSVYTFWKRGMPPPQMTILNAPARDACVARRETTNTPSQALLLLNENAYFEAASAFALRLIDKPESERIVFAWESITGKLPDKKEVEVVAELLEDLKHSYAQQPELAQQIGRADLSEQHGSNADLAAWTVVINTLFNLDITKNRD